MMVVDTIFNNWSVDPYKIFSIKEEVVAHWPL